MRSVAGTCPQTRRCFGVRWQSPGGVIGEDKDAAERLPLSTPFLHLRLRLHLLLRAAAKRLSCLYDDIRKAFVSQVQMMHRLGFVWGVHEWTR